MCARLHIWGLWQGWALNSDLSYIQASPLFWHDATALGFAFPYAKPKKHLVPFVLSACSSQFPRHLMPSKGALHPEGAGAKLCLRHTEINSPLVYASVCLF